MGNKYELALKQREEADKAWKRANSTECATPLADIPDNEEEN